MCILCKNIRGSKTGFKNSNKFLIYCFDWYCRVGKSKHYGISFETKLFIPSTTFMLKMKIYIPLFPKESICFIRSKKYLFFTERQSTEYRPSLFFSKKKLQVFLSRVWNYQYEYIKADMPMDSLFIWCRWWRSFLLWDGRLVEEEEVLAKKEIEFDFQEIERRWHTLLLLWL